MWAKTPIISFSAHWDRPLAHKKLGAERSWFNVGSASQMVAQHSTSIGPTSHNHLTYCALQRVHGVWSSEVTLYKSYPAYMVAILSDGCTFYVTICRLTTSTTASLQVIDVLSTWLWCRLTTYTTASLQVIDVLSTWLYVDWQHVPKLVYKS